ncbi:AGAP012889-PA [Anopheles gambiae str. PEST]|uniref:AGAP012889-PA n=2 Tax=cellular organisms TaxID=131567 RepID=A0NAQ9_ANOGA|nr:AGAP012889-PA [Anopheles gambiae str. PEST]
MLLAPEDHVTNTISRATGAHNSPNQIRCRLMISDITTRSFDALNAYGQTQRTLQGALNPAEAAEPSNDSVTSFSNVLGDALKNAVHVGKTAETQAATGLSGGGDMTDIATSVAEAKLTLQTVTTVRDRFVQAYQDIMKMSI